MWHFATGDRDAIAAFARRFGVSVMADGDAAGGITHNLRTAVLDKDGKVVQVFTGNEWTPEQLLDAVRRAGA
jgi:protein SCO1/2